MQVLGLGNVTECNYSYIFLNNEGKQDRIKATKDLLSAILKTSSTNTTFYERMYTELSAEYEKRKTEVYNKYRFITDEMVEDAYRRSRLEGFELSLKKPSNNEECIRQFSKVAGIFDGARVALDRKWEAHKLLKQAETSMQKFK